MKTEEESEQLALGTLGADTFEYRVKTEMK